MNYKIIKIGFIYSIISLLTIIPLVIAIPQEPEIPANFFAGSLIEVKVDPVVDVQIRGSGPWPHGEYYSIIDIKYEECGEGKRFIGDWSVITYYAMDYVTYYFFNELNIPFDYTNNSPPEDVFIKETLNIPVGKAACYVGAIVTFDVYEWKEVDGVWDWYLVLPIQSDDDEKSSIITFSLDDNCGVPQGTEINISQYPYTKNIEDIQVGEIIKSYDTSNKTVIEAEVTEVINITEDLPEYLIEINRELHFSPDFLLYINNTEWKEAENVSLGDFMTTCLQGGAGIGFTEIWSIEEIPTPPETVLYNLCIKAITPASDPVGYWANGKLGGK